MIFLFDFFLVNHHQSSSNDSDCLPDFNRNLTLIFKFELDQIRINLVKPNELASTGLDRIDPISMNCTDLALVCAESIWFNLNLHDELDGNRLGRGVVPNRFLSTIELKGSLDRFEVILNK